MVYLIFQNTFKSTDDRSAWVIPKIIPSVTSSELKHVINPGHYFYYIILYPTTEYVLCQSFVLANCIESFGIGDRNSFKSLFFRIKPSTLVGIAFKSLFGFIEEWCNCSRSATDSYHCINSILNVIYYLPNFLFSFLSKWIYISSWSFGKNLKACVACCHSLQNLGRSVSSITATFLVHRLFLNIFNACSIVLLLGKSRFTVSSHKHKWTAKIS